MLTDRVFRLALIFSICCHAVIFYNWPALKNLPILKTYSKIEITYFPQSKTPPLSGLVSEQEAKGKFTVPQSARSAESGVKKGDLAKPTYDSKESFRHTFEKPLSIEREDMAVHAPSREKMLISHGDKDLTDKPTYLSYYNAIRSKIHKTANATKPYNFIEGEVRLVFTVARDGGLLKAGILEQESTKNPALLDHALASLKRASPFPPFLSSMKEEYLTFRLTISFEK